MHTNNIIKSLLFSKSYFFFLRHNFLFTISINLMSSIHNSEHVVSNNAKYLFNNCVYLLSSLSYFIFIIKYFEARFIRFPMIYYIKNKIFNIAHIAQTSNKNSKHHRQPSNSSFLLPSNLSIFSFTYSSIISDLFIVSFF